MLSEDLNIQRAIHHKLLVHACMRMHMWKDIQLTSQLCAILYILYAMYIYYVYMYACRPGKRNTSIPSGHVAMDAHEYHVPFDKRIYTITGVYAYVHTHRICIVGMSADTHAHGMHVCIIRSNMQSCRPRIICLWIVSCAPTTLKRSRMSRMACARIVALGFPAC